MQLQSDLDDRSFATIVFNHGLMILVDRAYLARVLVAVRGYAVGVLVAGYSEIRTDIWSSVTSHRLIAKVASLATAAPEGSL